MLEGKLHRHSPLNNSWLRPTGGLIVFRMISELAVHKSTQIIANGRFCNGRQTSCCERWHWTNGCRVHLSSTNIYATVWTETFGRRAAILWCTFSKIQWCRNKQILIQWPWQVTWYSSLDGECLWKQRGVFPSFPVCRDESEVSGTSDSGINAQLNVRAGFTVWKWQRREERCCTARHSQWEALWCLIIGIGFAELIWALRLLCRLSLMFDLANT